MTSIYEEKTELKEVVTKKRIKTICDWCGVEIPESHECEDGFYPETHIEFSEKYRCYDSGNAVYWEVDDLCLDCGRKLKDAIVNLGITIKEGEYDW